MKRVLQINLKIVFILCFSAVVFGATAQTGTITGTVTDDKGDGIIGASVLLVGSTTGTVTDLDGNYTLEVPPGEAQISISYVGYLKEEATVTVASGQTTNYSAMLSEDMLQLEDVVVIGYGSVKKSDLTGAVASVSSDDITKTSESNISNSLQGKAAGVRVSQQSGSPGGTSEVYIRGITSINGSQAMWVIDGVPGGANTVNPNDVESIEILKDAATCAIYGASGGNGVVIVTTKKGKAGKTTATFNASYGWQKVPESSYIDLATGPEFAEIYTYKQAKYRERSYYFFPDGLADGMDFSDVPNYDYQRMIFRTAPMQEYHLSVNGGNEKSTFALGLGYTDQEGVLKKSAYDKISARINSDHKLNKWFRVGENISLIHESRDGFDEWEYENTYWSPITMATQYHPFVSPYVSEDEDGNTTPATEKNDDTNWSYSDLSNIMNPIAQMDLTNKNTTSTGIVASAYLEIEPIKGLTFLSRITGNANYGEYYSFLPVYSITSSNKNEISTITRQSNRYLSWQWQNYLTYNKSFFNVHNLTLMAGYESGADEYHYMSATRNDLIDDTEEMWYFDASLDEESTSQLPEGSGYKTSGFGYFGRIMYDYKSIVLGQVNFRHDESSLFGPRNRAGEFLSYSVGLKFTEFEFVRSALPFMNFGKLRWSSGEIGSNTLDPYEYFAQVYTKEVLDYSFDNSGTNSVGASPTNANQSIKWEGVETQNFGVDLGFFNNRLSLTAEWFKRQNNGMIMYPEIPGHAGWIVIAEYQEGVKGEVPMNIGQMVNKGYELQTGWKDSYGRFSYSVDFNYTYVNTQAKSLPDTILAGEVTGLDYICRTVPNGPLSEFYGYQVDRIFTAEDYDESAGVITNQPYTEDPETGERVYAQDEAEPGDFKWKDINDDGKIDDKDIGPIGNPVPKHVFGFNMNASYGWFDFSMQIQAATGFEIFNGLKAFQFDPAGTYNWAGDYAGNFYTDDVVDRATGEVVFGENHDVKYPRLDLTNTNENYTSVSDFYVENGAYLKIQNLQFGVTLPEKYSEKAGVSSLRLYVSVQNLRTFTNYSGFSPEVGSSSLTAQGIDYGTYPRPRMFRLGATLKF